MKFPIYKQYDTMYSGAACIKMITDYNGQFISFNEIKQKFIIKHEGIDLSSIAEVFRLVGYKTSGRRVTVEVLEESVFPCLIPWDKNRFVILHNKKTKEDDTTFYIADPVLGHVSYLKDEFIKHWGTIMFGLENKGVILLIDKNIE